MLLNSKSSVIPCLAAEVGKVCGQVAKGRKIDAAAKLISRCKTERATAAKNRVLALVAELAEAKAAHASLVDVLARYEATAMKAQNIF